MTKLTFNAIIKIRIGNPYILVSAVRAKKIKAGWKKPMPVLIRINGEPKKAWKINMMPIGNGSFYLYLDGEVRKASKTKVGDRVDVEIEFDSSYRNGPMHDMPEWFRVPLSKNKKARKAWDELTPSRQKEILRYFSWLKSDEAKERNLQKVMSILGGSPGRFMARDWN
jgi:hypothetical protein